MIRSPGYCGVILAAGTPERLSKSLSRWPEGNPLGSTLLSTQVDALNTVSELVLVVAGSNEAVLTPTVYAHGGFVVSTSGCGDFECLQLGVREVLNRGRDTAIVTSGDMSPLPPLDYRALCDAYQQSDRETWAVALKSAGTNSYPLIAGRELIEELLRASAASSLQGVLVANAAHVLRVHLGEATECAQAQRVQNNS
ncbi:MAG TPA: NTP transferase domain-containing protein [Candidatus Acidoferrales bacterium]|nr:NTP transferase domain-containing protein [Candidatus Acidoferrales bacterium]